MPQKKSIPFLIVGILLIGIGLSYRYLGSLSPHPSPASSPIATSTASAKENLIRVRTIRPGDTVQSPLAVEGEALGTWFFEASFPVRLIDGNDKEIAVTPAQAQGEWMTQENLQDFPAPSVNEGLSGVKPTTEGRTQDFVPFRALLTFAPPQTAEGTLILEKNNPSGLPENADELRIPVRFPQHPPATNTEIEIVAEGLAIPWDIAFLPGGELLATERPGRLVKIGKEKQVIPVEGVRHRGEGGLLGLALHPRFRENHWLYLYLTTGAASGLSNRIERYQFENDRLVNRTVILQGIPGAIYHDGGKIAFGPDGYLYVIVGDATQTNFAQNRNSLAGKILRLKDDGSIPADNPFGNATYSYGHRNPQGLAWDSEGRLWATEHGRSGILSGLDELNRIEKGANYGWPTIEGDKQKDGMRAPMINSGPNETWAPASAVFYQGSIFFTGLRGESLYQATISTDGNVTGLKKHLTGRFGRLRALTLGPDGNFYISTSNQDGRGEPRMGDDKIIRVNPRMFESH